TINKNAKPYGKVRFYRKVSVMTENVKNALVIYTKGGNDTISDATNPLDAQEQQELIDDDVLAPRLADQISELNPKIARLQELAGDDFSQLPRSEKDRLEFAITAAEVNGQVQRITQQGYALGSMVEDVQGQETKLDIADTEQLNTLQARLNDVNEVLPPEKKIDVTNIKIAMES